MLDELVEAERALPVLLADRTGWTSLWIDYHPPYVERLWRAWGACRINLHRIHPCKPCEALFHPHPWPSAMVLLEGCYEMAIGHGRGARPPVAARLIATAGVRYEMPDPDSWHHVRPIDEPVLSLMVTGPPWPRPAPQPARPLVPLDDARTQALFERFEVHYPWPGGWAGGAGGG